MASRLEKISILLLLVLMKTPLQYWVQFWLSHFKSHGGEIGERSAVGCQDGQGPSRVTYGGSLKEFGLLSLLKRRLRGNLIAPYKT